MEGWRSAAILSVPLTAPHQALSLTDIRMKTTEKPRYNQTVSLFAKFRLKGNIVNHSTLCLAPNPRQGRSLG